MLGKRLVETFAMTIIGDSLLCAIMPQRHISLWRDGPPWWRALCDPLIRHPELTRALGPAGVGFGFWLARRQESAVA